MKTFRLKSSTPVVAWPGFAPTRIVLPAGTAIREVDRGRWVVADQELVAKLTRNPVRAEGYWVYVPASAVDATSAAAGGG
jgi:hypothetical protein